MERYYFDLFSSREVHRDQVGDLFSTVRDARRMARSVLLDYAQHRYPNGEECLIVCKLRTAAPERFYLTSLAILDEAVSATGADATVPVQENADAALEGEVAYRMSADWTDMHELRSDGFLRTVDAPERAWFMNFIPREERPRVAAAIDRAIQLRAPFHLEHKVIRADESIGWAASRALPVVDERGQITEWVGVAKDVTARH